MKDENEKAADEKQQASNHTKAMLILDKIGTAIRDSLSTVTQDELDELRPAFRDIIKEALSKAFRKMGKSKSLNFLWIRIIVIVCLIISNFFQIIATFMSLLLGDNAARLAVISYTMHTLGFFKVISGKKHQSLKFLLVSYEVQFLLNTMLAGYAMLVVWSPSLCCGLGSCTSYQQSQKILGFLRPMGSIMVMGHIVFQALVLHIFQKVDKHAKKFKKPKKQTSHKTTSARLKDLNCSDFFCK